MQLKDLVVRTKEAMVPFEGLEGFEVQLAAVSREVSKKLREDSETTKMDVKMRGPVKELNEAVFITNFAKAAIKGWKGLKYKYLDSLLLVDLTDVEDLEAEVPYTQESAELLLKSSPIFDSWVNDKVFALDSFRNGKG